MYALVSFFVFVLPRAGVLGAPACPVESASLTELSALSISRLLDVAEGVLEPVRAGELSGVSLKDDGMDVGEDTIAFSLPVTASDIARKPKRFCLALDLPDKRGRGEDLPLPSLSGRGEGIGRLAPLPSSRFVTVGDSTLGESTLAEVPDAVRALADRKRLLKLLL